MVRSTGLRLGALLVSFVVAACSSAAATATPAPPASAAPVPSTVAASTAPAPSASAGFSCTGKTIAYASFGSQFPFIALVDQSVKAAAAKAGVNLLFYDNADNANTALSNASLITSHGGVDMVIWFNYFQTENLTIGETFNAAKLPVIAIDIPVPGATFYGANNFLAGQIAGQGLAAAAQTKWGGSVDLALVEKQSGPGQELLQQRTLGIVDGISKALPSLPAASIIQVEGGLNAQAAQTAIATALTAHPGAKHILIGMLGDTNAVAAANAAQEANRADQVLTAGQGGDDVGLKELRGPVDSFVGTTDYLPNLYGNDVIPLACNLLAGQQEPAQVFVKHVFLTRDNINQIHPLSSAAPSPSN
jgi:ribose transport system substrate-binding protein